MKLLKGEPVVSMMPETLNKIRKYTKLCEHSIYWMGKVMHLENEYYIDDVVLLPQTVGKNGSIDFEKFSDVEFLIENEGYEAFCIGRTKKSKSVAVTNSDLDFLKTLAGESGYMIYIQTNNKNDLSLTLVDYDRDLLFDDLQLVVSDTEFFTDEEIMAEIAANVSLAVSKHDYKYGKKYLDTGKSEKVIEIRETTNSWSDKAKKELVEVKEKVSEMAGQLVIEEGQKVEYEPNEFVKENVDFRLLVTPKGGDANDAT